MNKREAQVCATVAVLAVVCVGWSRAQGELADVGLMLIMWVNGYAAKVGYESYRARIKAEQVVSELGQAMAQASIEAVRFQPVVMPRDPKVH